MSARTAASSQRLPAVPGDTVGRRRSCSVQDGEGTHRLADAQNHAQNSQDIRSEEKETGQNSCQIKEETGRESDKGRKRGNETTQSQGMTLTILREVFGVWYLTKDVPTIGGSDKRVRNRIYDTAAGVSPCGALNSKGTTDSHNTCSWLSQNP